VEKMRSDTVRLNITLSKDLVTSLDQITGPRKRSRFIEEALEIRVKQKQKEKMDKLLKEGYRATKKESLALSREFELVDLEGWHEY
jgi:CopG family transcriptional regulator / antitoxin EndoAI